MQTKYDDNTERNDRPDIDNPADELPLEALEPAERGHRLKYFLPAAAVLGVPALIALFSVDHARASAAPLFLGIALALALIGGARYAMRGITERVEGTG